MHALAAEVVAEGGPSAPAWAFFTAISLALIAILGQQLQAKRAANIAKNEAADAKTQATQANENAAEAAQNTAGISNGFAKTVGGKLDRILSKQDALEQSLREHIEWHLENRE